MNTEDGASSGSVKNYVSGQGTDSDNLGIITDYVKRDLEESTTSIIDKTLHNYHQSVDELKKNEGVKIVEPEEFPEIHSQVAAETLDNAETSPPEKETNFDKLNLGKRKLVSQDDNKSDSIADYSSELSFTTMDSSEIENLLSKGKSTTTMNKERGHRDLTESWLQEHSASPTKSSLVSTRNREPSPEEEDEEDDPDPNREPIWDPNHKVYEGYVLWYDDGIGKGQIRELKNIEPRTFHLWNMFPRYASVEFGAKVKYQWSEHGGFGDFWVVSGSPCVSYEEGLKDTLKYPMMRGERRRR